MAGEVSPEPSLMAQPLPPPADGSTVTTPSAAESGSVTLPRPRAPSEVSRIGYTPGTVSGAIRMAQVKKDTPSGTSAAVRSRSRKPARESSRMFTLTPSRLVVHRRIGVCGSERMMP